MLTNIKEVCVCVCVCDEIRKRKLEMLYIVHKFLHIFFSKQIYQDTHSNNFFLSCSVWGLNVFPYSEGGNEIVSENKVFRKTFIPKKN
jgi:hypothetical protein